MKTNFVHFKLGAFACTSLLDGYVDYTLQNMYANVPRAQVEAALRQHGLPVEFVTTPYTYLFVDTGQNRVLVDMGAGDLDPDTGNLVHSMRAAGIEPTSIDAVFITHAHPDHIGGALDEQGRPIYTNARYYIWGDEWNFWFSDLATAKITPFFVDVARKRLEPLKDRMVLVEKEGEALPGVQVIFAPGHTPGHMVVTFESQGKKLFYIGDTVLQPLHLEHTDWLPVYDILPEKAALSKARIFNLAVDEHAMVIGQHFAPFPSLGAVTRQAGGWLWKPVEIQEN